MPVPTYYRLDDIIFDYFHTYLSLIQTTVNKQETSNMEEYKKAQKEGVDDNNYYSTAETDYYYYQGMIDDFSQLMYSNFILMWYAFIEKELVDFVTRLQGEEKVNDYKKRNRDTGIDLAYKLLKEKPIEYCIDNKSWGKLKTIQKLRNKIAHDENRFHGQYKKPLVSTKFIEKLMTVEDDTYKVYFKIANNFDKEVCNYLDRHGISELRGKILEIIPNYNYCSWLLDFGKSLLETTYNEAQKK